MSNRLVEQIDKQIPIASAHRQEAEAARKDVETKLLGNLSDDALHAERVQLEAEIKTHADKIAWMEKARAKAVAGSTPEAIQARANDLRSAADTSKQVAVQREGIDTEIAKCLEPLGPLLAKRAELNATLKDQFWKLARSASASIDSAASHNTVFLRIAAGDGGRVPAALTHQLYDAKVGRLGIVVDSHFLEVGRMDTTLSLTDAARADTDRLVQRVEELLGQCMKRLGVQP